LAKSKVKFDRLNIELEIMNNVIKNRKPFDLGSWVRHVPGHSEPHCGTACCAFGEGAFDPRFQKMGLKLTYDSWEWGNTIDPCASPRITKTFKTVEEFNLFAHERETSRTIKLNVQYKGLKGMGAASKFFGITEEEAEFLFDPEEYPDRYSTKAVTVRNRIRNFIARKTDEITV
jgi:hypothetical protein